MIGFFQNSMAKHHRLVFGVLLVFIVVSFVFYTGSGSAADLLGIRRASVVMGVNLNNREETAPYSLGVALSGGGRVTTAALLQRISSSRPPKPAAFRSRRRKSSADFFPSRDSARTRSRRFGANTTFPRTCFAR